MKIGYRFPSPDCVPQTSRLTEFTRHVSSQNQRFEQADVVATTECRVTFEALCFLMPARHSGKLYKKFKYTLYRTRQHTEVGSPVSQGLTSRQASIVMPLTTDEPMAREHYMESGPVFCSLISPDVPGVHVRDNDCLS